MSSSLSKIFLVIFAVVALVGWAVAINLFFRVLPPVSVADSELASVAQAYARNLTTAQAEGGRFERVTDLATGQALSSIEAQAAANPAPLPDLSYVSGDFNMRYRIGTMALVEGVYTISQDGNEEQIIELYELTYDDEAGRWKVALVQRVEATPSGPVVPSESTPGASPSPAESGAPDESAPAASPSA
jgi:hypothetical protein